MAATQSRTRRSSSSTRRSSGTRTAGQSSSRRSSRRTASRTSRTASRSRSSRTNRTSSSSRRSSTSSSGGKGYSSIKGQLQQTIQSLQQLKSQTEGTTTKGRPSPTTLNRFANVVSKGGVVRQASTQAIQRAAHWNKPCKSASSAFKALKSKYGSTIKAVAPAKNGGWLIAASPTWKGKPFKFGK